MTTKPLNQNADRYKKIEQGWQVSATSSITPLILTKGIEPKLVPLLDADGVVVRLYDTYLVSKGTLKLIENLENPHYDIVENGKVKVKNKQVTMGKTIPIININVDGLAASGSQRTKVDIYAGVKDVTFNYLTNRVEGVPKGLLDQINYTIGTTDRPADTYSVFDLSGSLTADYSIDALIIETQQDSGSLDKVKLQKFQQGIADRLKILRTDFNSIKQTFYNGKAPNTINAFTYTKVASTDDSQETIDQKLSTPVVIKDVSFIGVKETPAQATAQAAKEAKDIALAPPTPPTPAESELIIKWQGYNLTGDEKALLKSQASQTNPIWPPLLMDKLKIAYAKFIGGFGLFTNPKTTKQYYTYYGKGKSTKEYNNLNDNKKSEFQALVKSIKELESKNGKTY
jgi:hypothetical protein